MAITRREFTTTLAALAAAVGLGSAEIESLSQAYAGVSPSMGGNLGKPRVVWVHGAECTGCSTSLLSFLEDLNGQAVYGTNVTTGAALGIAGVSLTIAPGATRNAIYGTGTSDASWANIADVVIDVVDLQYHETVMNMGGDLAAQLLKDWADYNPTGLAADAAKPGEKPFVLVVEGALQDKNKGGAWADDANNGDSWCSIGMSDTTGVGAFENDMAETVVKLATKSTCIGIIPIGQCATFGGYPGCKPQISQTTAGTAGAGGFTATMSQTGAMGTYDYLSRADVDGGSAAARAAAAKVINVPGCPTNPWWFCLTVVIFMVNLADPSTAASLGLMATDSSRRLKAAYPIPVHSPMCPRYSSYNAGVYALKAGDPGCLQKIGCKGLMTNSLCGLHGWNNQQPQNGKTLGTSALSLASLNGGKGGHCTKSGHPCMACTEKGYPDAFVPFVKKG